MVDFHSHILPQMDDGSASVRESMAMLQMEAEQGIDHVVITPHFYAEQDTPERFFARRDASEAMLREQMLHHDGLPRLHLGAEVRYFPGMQYSESLSRFAVDGQNAILIEMPFCEWTSTMYSALEEIYSRQGLTPVIAHVERYMHSLRMHRLPAQLVQLPVLVQANSSFFLNLRTRRAALKLLRENRIHLIGSDCHNLSGRKPDLGRAAAVIRKQLGEEPLMRLEKNAHRMLAETASGAVISNMR